MRPLKTAVMSAGAFRARRRGILGRSAVQLGGSRDARGGRVFARLGAIAQLHRAMNRARRARGDPAAASFRNRSLCIQPTKATERPAPGGGPGRLIVTDERTGKKYTLEVSEGGNIKGNDLAQVRRLKRLLLDLALPPRALSHRSRRFLAEIGLVGNFMRHARLLGMVQTAPCARRSRRAGMGTLCGSTTRAT